MGRLQHSDDLELLSLMKQSDYEAFDELYNRYWRKLFLIAIKKTGCKEDSMDLVQELFIELWHKRESLLIMTSINTYLISCLYYKTFQYFRIKGIEEKHILNFQKFLQQGPQIEPDPVSHQEKELEYEYLQALINQTIDEMPAKMRQVFLMTRTGEQPISEIAAALNITPQTVKNQAGNAIQRLKR